MNLKISRVKRALTSLTVFILALSISAVPAFAETAVEGGDATKNVHTTETVYRWFYWPGWAYAALTALVLLLVLVAWYKSVLGPKYRGKKVAQ